MYKLFHLLFLAPIMVMNAQTHEFGVFLGGSNYIGDIGSTTYIAPNEPAFGILYKWNKSPRHAYRFSYTQSKIVASDLGSKELSRYGREYHFENNIKEVSLGLEFNFFDFDLFDFKTKFTPYIYSGLSGFLGTYSLTTPDLTTVGVITVTKKEVMTSIPMIIGIKSNINNSIIIGLETGLRYTFSDNFDGSRTNHIIKRIPYLDKTISKFGNVNNNDWYVFSGLTLTYTFGKKPCYCAK